MVAGNVIAPSKGSTNAALIGTKGQVEHTSSLDYAINIGHGLETS